MAGVDPEVQEKKETPEPTALEFRLRDDSKRLVNDAGWALPDMSLFKEKSRQWYDAKTSVRVEEADYLPLIDVVQWADGNPSIYIERDPALGSQPWQITHLKVFSAQGRPFCLVMKGVWVNVDTEGKIIARAAMTISLVYSDQDGDGRFETFQYSGSEAPVIPERLKRR
ncbi:MAG: hypothetical protein LC113_10615 [Acidobacteria bacterium]|nr:hypothetical protein [Acidobacteriota bacterium]